MNILEWWAMHPEVIAVGQNNTDKVASILARKEFDINPLPKEWEHMTIKLQIEGKKSPDPDFEDLSF